MNDRKSVDTTLGDLVIAVTDEVNHWVHDQAAAYLIVSCILSELLTQSRTRFKTRRSAMVH